MGPHRSSAELGVRALRRGAWVSRRRAGVSVTAVVMDGGPWTVARNHCSDAVRLQAHFNHPDRAVLRAMSRLTAIGVTAKDNGVAARPDVWRTDRSDDSPRSCWPTGKGRHILSTCVAAPPVPQLTHYIVRILLDAGGLRPAVGHNHSGTRHASSNNCITIRSKLGRTLARRRAAHETHCR